MPFQFYILFLLVIISFSNSTSNTEYCVKQECDAGLGKYRYLFYDVNPPEGFNLRRDVYIRYAVFAHYLNNSPKKNLNNFKLVLPPWPNLYHWGTGKRLIIPWSHFFDLKSLQNFSPVIEMHQFFHEFGNTYSKIKIDEVYILQHFEEMFKTGKFEDKMEVQKCGPEIAPFFYYYENVTSDHIKCLLFHGYVSHLSTLLENSNSRMVLFNHAEIASHDHFGDKIYWQARRSMRFNKDLKVAAAKFRKKYLNSTDELDNTLLPDDWRDEKPKRNAKGGQYLGVHLRRQDFVRGRPADVPSIKNAAKQIKELLKKLNLIKVYIATDASPNEYEELCNLLIPEYAVYKFSEEQPIKNKYKEGEFAIIEQIICSHAQYFVGTHESTFSYRIQEEREILGFPIETTFNRLCGNNENKHCEKPLRWTIVY